MEATATASPPVALTEDWSGTRLKASLTRPQNGCHFTLGWVERLRGGLLDGRVEQEAAVAELRGGALQLVQDAPAEALTAQRRR
jgi:hypothetical protein